MLQDHEDFDQNIGHGGKTGAKDIYLTQKVTHSTPCLKGGKGRRSKIRNNRQRLQNKDINKSMRKPLGEQAGIKAHKVRQQRLSATQDYTW